MNGKVMLDVTVRDGKYRVVMDDDGLRALRYGEEWRSLTGDNLVYALASEVRYLRTKLETIENILKEGE